MGNISAQISVLFKFQDLEFACFRKLHLCTPLLCLHQSTIKNSMSATFTKLSKKKLGKFGRMFILFMWLGGCLEAKFLYCLCKGSKFLFTLKWLLSL